MFEFVHCENCNREYDKEEAEHLDARCPNCGAALVDGPAEDEEDEGVSEQEA